MRISPNHPRLRIIALSCWIFGAWCMIQPGLLAAIGLPAAGAAIIFIFASLVLAVGVTFWLLGNDHRAGVTFDRKGLTLNLGHSAAFVAWDNIAAIGVTRRRASLFALGSRAQLGIALHDPAPYIQSYEARLPAARGLIASAVRLIRRLIGRDREAHEPSVELLAELRRCTGYDILISEAQLGGSAAAFVTLLKEYRAHPEQRQNLPIGVVIHR